MSILIQTKLHYSFVHEQFLDAALRSAHRGKEDDALDDGNRGLAHYGKSAIQMAMTYEAIIDNGKTLNDINAQDHWSKTKRGRAKACRLLGIEPFITRSVRQQHQPLSDTVLDHALSAVLGAIWLDGECQEHQIPKIRSTILEVIRTIDVVFDKHSTTAGCTTRAEQSPTHHCALITNSPEERLETTKLNILDWDEVDRFTREWFEQDVDGFSSALRVQQHQPAEVQPIACPNEYAALYDSRLVDGTNAPSPALDNDHPAYERCRFQLCAEDQRNGFPDARREPAHLLTSQTTCSDAVMTVKGAKRKRSQDESETFASGYQKILQAERQKLKCVSQADHDRLIRFLEHPMLNELEKRDSMLARFLYLAIGSWETIVDFKELLSQGRSDSSICRQPSLLSGDAAAMYDAICKLEKEETLCMLLKRYHVINLCEEEQLYNDDHSHIIVETPSTFDEHRLAKPGNPVFVLHSSFTDRLLFKIMPNADPESDKFKKARRKVKRLRKLAERLRFLVKCYGLGILGLLPSGPSFEQMSLTDNMVLAMTDASFHDFARLLHEEQGPHLKSLSGLIEPSLIGLVMGSPNSDTLCQQVNAAHLSSFPKGFMRRGLLPLEPDA